MNRNKETLRKIEKKEKSWHYELTPEEEKKHSYGRVPEDKNSVAFWSVPRRTGDFLEFMTEITNSKTILELGCSVGYSTLFLANAAKHTNGHVYTTEILEQKIELAKTNFKNSGLSNYITLFEHDILNVLNNWNTHKKADLIFLDADKEKYSVYLDLMLPILNEEGIIIVDNAGKVRMQDGKLIDCEHINKFVKYVKSNKKLDSIMINMDNGLLLIKKN